MMSFSGWSLAYGLVAAPCSVWCRRSTVRDDAARQFAEVRDVAMLPSVKRCALACLEVLAWTIRG